MLRGRRREHQIRDVRGSSFDLAVDAPPAPDVPNSATPSVDYSSPQFGGCDVVNAILEVAHNVAQQSQVPGVCEAAMLVSTLVNLISADRTNIADAEERLQRCHLLATMLQRAATVLEQVWLSGRRHHCFQLSGQGLSSLYFVAGRCRSMGWLGVLLAHTHGFSVVARNVQAN